MTIRWCPYCGSISLTRIESNTVEDIRQNRKSFYISVVYWRCKECGYYERTRAKEYNESEHAPYEVLNFKIPKERQSVNKMPAYLREKCLE